MRNERLRQAKIARNKKRREHHNKTYDARSKCEFGSQRSRERENEHKKIMNKIEKEFGL